MQLQLRNTDFTQDVLKLLLRRQNSLVVFPTQSHLKLFIQNFPLNPKREDRITYKHNVCRLMTPGPTLIGFNIREIFLVQVEQMSTGFVRELRLANPSSRITASIDPYQALRWLADYARIEIG